MLKITFLTSSPNWYLQDNYSSPKMQDNVRKSASFEPLLSYLSFGTSHLAYFTSNRSVFFKKAINFLWLFFVWRPGIKVRIFPGISIVTVTRRFLSVRNRSPKREFCGVYDSASSLVIWDGLKAKGLTRRTQTLLRPPCPLKRRLLMFTFFKNGILSSHSVLRPAFINVSVNKCREKLIESVWF